MVIIYTTAKITIHSGDRATINSPILLYKGDKNIEVQFEIVESLYRQYKQQEGGNTIYNLGASYGQLLIQKPDFTSAISDVTETKDGRIIFVIPEEMTDEDVELGFYTFQIRLYDETQRSRVTLPPVVNGIEILSPIVTE